jgi:hypothetical protein
MGAGLGRETIEVKPTKTSSMIGAVRLTAPRLSDE